MIPSSVSGLSSRMKENLLTSVGEVLAGDRGGNSGSAGAPGSGRRMVVLEWLYEGMEIGEGLGRFSLSGLDENVGVGIVVVDMARGNLALALKVRD